MPEPGTLRLQRRLADLVLEAAPPAHLEDLDEGLRAYRDLVRFSLVDPLESMFPLAMALLEPEGAWTEGVDAFLEARRIPSPHHRDIAPAFLGWLADTGWGQDRWPFLLELVHWELLETLVYRFEDLPPPPGLGPRPDPASRLVLAPATQLVTYAHAVHRATVEAPSPAPGTTHLLAFRDPEGRFQARELTPAATFLLAEGAVRPLGGVLAELGLADPGPSLDLLGELRMAGAIAGFA